MPFTGDHDPINPIEKRDSLTAPPSPVPSMEEGLDEIDRILHQMLVLAELSAHGGDGIDRTALQRTLDRLRQKLDQIADQLGTTGSG